MLSWWWFVLLALASWRVYRLLAEDTILETPRRKLLRMSDSWAEEGDDPGEEYLWRWGLWLGCPYCAGFWVSGVVLIAYSIIIDWPGTFEFIVSWLALSAAVALLAKIDDLLNKGA